MARPRAFDEATVLAQSRALFATQGYNGTSIDDLVKATGLLRGSLYKAFGSKRNLFELVLADAAQDFGSTPENVDLLTVALKDLAPHDSRVRALCRSIVGNDTHTFAELIGNTLLTKMKEN
jgi:AcrR family transcriptional regulator